MNKNEICFGIHFQYLTLECRSNLLYSNICTTVILEGFCQKVECHKVIFWCHFGGVYFNQKGCKRSQILWHFWWSKLYKHTTYKYRVKSGVEMFSFFKLKQPTGQRLSNVRTQKNKKFNQANLILILCIIKFEFKTTKGFMV